MMSSIIAQVYQYSSVTSPRLTITELIVLDLDMLHTTMGHRILRRLDARLAVSEVWSRLICSRQNLTE